jgi:hypothetical protein
MCLDLIISESDRVLGNEEEEAEEEAGRIYVKSADRNEARDVQRFTRPEKPVISQSNHRVYST